MSLPLALSALSLHGRETGKGRIHTVCICILLSYQRVKEESSLQLMSVWLFHLKKTQRRLHRLHVVPCTFRIIRSALRRSPWLRDGSPVSPIPSRGLPRHHCSQKRRARVTRTVRDFTGQTVACASEKKLTF